MVLFQAYSSLANFFFLSFAYLLIGLVCFLMLNSESNQYILETSPLLICDLQIFSVTLLKEFFMSKSFSFSGGQSYQLFLLWVMLWGSSVRILHLVLGLRLFSMLFFFFFSKNVMLLYFTFKSLIHFELFFVQSVSFRLRLIFKNCPWIPIHLFLIFFFFFLCVLQIG